MTTRRMIDADITDRAEGKVPVWRAASGTHEYDDPASVSGAFVGAKVYHNTTQSYTSATHTAINCNTDDFDVDGYHDPVTNNTRLTVPAGKGGIHRVRAFVYTGVSNAKQLYFRTAGGAIRGTLHGQTGVSIETSALVDLADADYVEAVFVNGATGNAGHASAVEAQTTFEIERMGDG